jgi:peptidoglycan/xylan/chitin deacetylase (PgdA/CDA1 family)/GT2 family glycosyltransferase
MNGAGPELSVVIASHERRDLLRRCLESLRGQTAAPGSFEVIVADDGSGDGTAEMVEAFEAPFPLRVLRLQQGGQAAAQNAAIAAAEGQACLFLDDDMIASPGLVAAHLDVHREEPMTLSVGKLHQQPVDGRDPFAHHFARVWDQRYEELAAKEEIDWADCYGGNMAAPRAVLREIGGFATDLPSSEDLEIALRLTEAGCRPRYVAAAEAVHDDQKPGRTILVHTERFGSFCAWFVRSRPHTRQRLLGWFAATTPREVLLRRALLWLRLPPQRLVAAGRLFPPGPREVWFGFVSRYAFWRGVRGAMDREQWRQVVAGVPVLMYHAFSEDEGGDRFVISRRRFERHLRLLRLLRYRTIPLEELAQALREDRPLPRRTVVITIDDGYRDNLEIALPALRHHRCVATLFVVSGRLDTRNEWDDEGAVSGRPMLSPEQLREWRDAGMLVGAHTRTHPALPEIGDEQVSDEIGGSGKDLEELLGEPVPTFSYPYGRFDARAVEAAGTAGYEAAVTTWGQPARPGEDPLRIPRIEIEGADSPLRLLRKLKLGGS